MFEPGATFRVQEGVIWDVESGMPTLTDAGKKALEEEMKEQATHPLEQ